LKREKIDDDALLLSARGVAPFPQKAAPLLFFIFFFTLTFRRDFMAKKRRGQQAEPHLNLGGGFAAANVLSVVFFKLQFKVLFLKSARARFFFYNFRIFFFTISKLTF